MDVSEKNAYLKAKRLRAATIPLGIFFLVASYGATCLFMMLPAIQSGDANVIATFLDHVINIESHEFLDISFDGKHVLSPLVFITFLIVGITLLRYSKSARSDLIEAYDRLNFVYSDEEKAESRRKARKWWMPGIAVGIASVAAFVFFYLQGNLNLSVGLGLVLAAIASALISHGVLLIDGIDLYAYNFDALRSKSIFVLDKEIQGRDHDILVKIKKLQMINALINRVVLIVGTVGTLALYFLPTLKTPLFWLPLAIAFILDFAITHVNIRRSRKFYSQTDEYTTIVKNEPDAKGVS